MHFQLELFLCTGIFESSQAVLFLDLFKLHYHADSSLTLSIKLHKHYPKLQMIIHTTNGNLSEHCATWHTNRSCIIHNTLSRICNTNNKLFAPSSRGEQIIHNRLSRIYNCSVVKKAYHLEACMEIFRMAN